jgi:hypothetical protein
MALHVTLPSGRSLALHPTHRFIVIEEDDEESRVLWETDSLGEAEFFKMIPRDIVVLDRTRGVLI